MPHFVIFKISRALNNNFQAVVDILIGHSIPRVLCFVCNFCGIRLVYACMVTNIFGGGGGGGLHFIYIFIQLDARALARSYIHRAHAPEQHNRATVTICPKTDGCSKNATCFTWHFVMSCKRDKNLH